MFKGLQQRWNVSAGRMVLILCTFALGGSACAWIARRIIAMLEIQGRGWRIALEIVLVTFLWPFTVLLISVLTGQFWFFVRYLQRMGARIGIGNRTRRKREKADSAKDHR